MAAITVGFVGMHIYRVTDDLPRFGENDFVSKLYNAGLDPYIINVNMEATTTSAVTNIPHTTDTEIFPPSVKLGLGGGTAVKLIIVSDNALDDADNAAGNAHTVQIIGWGVDADGNDRLITENVTMNGTTNVTSTYSFYEVFHARVIDWGTSNDKHAEGNITIEYPENTTLITISASENESNGSGFTIPLGWLCKTINSNIMTNNLTTSDGVIGEVRSIVEHSDGDKIDLDTNYYRVKASAYQNDKSFSPNTFDRINPLYELRLEFHLGHVGQNTCKAFWTMNFVIWKQTLTETIIGASRS